MPTGIVEEDARSQHPPAAPVAVLSFSEIASDQRVLRQVGFLAAQGLDPLVIGYGRPGDRIGHRFVAIEPPRPTLGHRLSTLMRQLPAQASRRTAAAGFWMSRRNRAAFESLRAAGPQLVLANDWPALVVGARLKRAQPGRLWLHYDSHELATEEFADSLWWRIVYRPYVAALEAASIAAADSISTVSPGIADVLATLYRLETPPALVRSVPNHQEVPEHSPSWPLTLLYHGNLQPGRGLEALLDSMPLWATPHRLILRGAGGPDYVARLMLRVRELGLADRVRIEPAVAPKDVVSRAADADVGVFFTPLDSAHQRFVLPNKLFEYIMAGLAVAISPAPHMSEVVSRYGVGLVGKGDRPHDIADAINALHPAGVEAYRLAARRAARELCWERESVRLAELLAPAIAGLKRRL